MPAHPDHALRLLLAACLACLACAGCARTPSTDLARWQLVLPGEPPQEVVLPARLSVPDRPLHYVLRADVPIPPQMRGAPVSLAIADTFAHATLRVDGEAALRCLDDGLERYRSNGAQCWHFDPRARSSVHLELEVDQTTRLTALFDTAPELVAASDGGARFRDVVVFDDVTGLGSVFAAALMAIFYAGAFLLDRSRRGHLWFALQAVGGMAYPLWWLGALQPTFGSADRCVLVLAMLGGGWASLQFTHDQLGLGSVPRAWGPILGVGAATGIAQAFPFPPPWLPLVTAAFISLPTAAVVVLCARALRSRERATAATIGLTWLTMLLVAPFEVPALVGLPAHEAGVRLMPLAMLVVGMGQGALLARKHVTSLRDADVLNTELRRQIAQRSHELADALAQLGSGGRQLGVGDVVNARYRIVRPLGAGGMGEVYEVERLSDGTRLALKVVQGAATRDQLARLAREAQLAAKIAHPNLVAIADVDFTTEHGVFLVMELVHGGSLVDQRGRYGDTTWALRVLRQVGEGLAALHDAGIVHRDLKPANVLLSVDGRVAKISDFGIASEETRVSSLASTVEHGDPTRRAAGLTRTGAILGTPLYMAPELATGSKSAAPPVDVFALGVLAYELLDVGYPFVAPPFVDAVYGRPPKRARTLATTPRVDARLAAVLEGCLEADPAGRPTAHAVVEALADFA